jgi:hypothetical protein
MEIREQLFSKSYSSVVKTSPLPPVENTNTKHTIIVKPNNDNSNCKQTEDIVKNIIIANNCKIGVKRVKNISKVGIAIECSPAEECDKALCMIKVKSTELSADKAALKSPKIVIYGITDDLTESEIINEIITKNQEIKTFVKDLNEEEFKKNLSIKFKFRHKTKSTVNTWVLEVNTEIRKIVMKSKNLLIGWKSCSVADYISILRCFRCNGFGHKGYDSSNPCKRDVCCGHCGESHETKRCKFTESNAFCINCDRFNKKSNKIIYNTNHSSFSSDCNCLIRIQNEINLKPIMDRNATQNINIESNIKCLQINLQRCKAATAHLMKYIENKNIDILLIQEPYFAKGKVCDFSSKYRIYYCESVERAKTAIIVINDLLQVVYIKTFIKDYLTVISVKFRNKLYYMFSLYCSPEQDLNRELQFLKSALIALKPQNVVISIDSNAKSRVWFSNSDDFRGELINDFIAENNLMLILLLMCIIGKCLKLIQYWITDT